MSGRPYDLCCDGGNCEDLFGACDSTSDFDFQTQTKALAAAAALLGDVFLDQGPSGPAFDTNPSRTNGCISTGPCQVFVPSAVSGSDVINAVANTAPPEVGGGTLAALFLTDLPTAGGDAAYASFAPAVAAAIALPASSLLLIGGLASLGGLARRRKG